METIFFLSELLLEHQADSPFDSFLPESNELIVKMKATTCLSAKATVLPKAQKHKIKTPKSSSILYNQLNIIHLTAYFEGIQSRLTGFTY